MAAVRLGRGRRVCGGKNKLRCKRHDDERQFARESKAEDFEHYTFAFNCKMSFREIRDALLLSYDSLLYLTLQNKMAIIVSSSDKN